MSAVLHVLLVCALSTLFVECGNPQVLQSSGTCQPAAPIAAEVDLDKMAGNWYSYQASPTTGIQYANKMLTYQSLGYVGSTNVHNHAWEIQYRDSATQKCNFIYVQSNRTTCGTVDNHYQFVGGDSGSSKVLTVYADPEFLEILLKCLDDACSPTSFFVHTRKNPVELRDDERALIQSIVDVRLAPYCITSDDLALVPFDSSLPLCKFESRPEEYLALIRSLLKTGQTKC